MIDWLALIQGRNFLWIYPVYALLVIFITKLLLYLIARGITTQNTGLKYNPLYLIILSKPTKEHMKAILEYYLYKLCQEKRIVFDENDRYFKVNPYQPGIGEAIKYGKDPIEDRLLSELTTPQTMNGLMRGTILTDTIQDTINAIKEFLVKEGLLLPPFYKLVSMLGLAIAVDGGVIVLIFELVYGKEPVVFLLLEVLAVWVVFGLFARNIKLTKVGQAYVGAAKGEYTDNSTFVE